MPFARFRVRTLMIAVAAVAMALESIAGLARRSARCFHRAARHQKLSEAEFLAVSLVHARHHFGLSEPERLTAEAHERMGAYHANLGAKYERAARHPWLPAPPDPPPIR